MGRRSLRRRNGDFSCFDLHYVLNVCDPKAIKAKRSIEGYIAKSAILCYQGNYEGAMQAFDLAFRHAGAEDVSFLLLVKVGTALANLHRDEAHCSIKAVLVFLSGLHNPAVSRVEELMKLEPDEPLHHLILVGRVSSGLLRRYNRDPFQAQMLVLLVAAAVDDGDYDHAIELLTRARDPGPFREDPRSQDLSMVRHIHCYHDVDMHVPWPWKITRWKLSRVRTTVYRQRCEVLLAAGYTKDATDSFHVMMNTLGNDTKSTDETEWVAGGGYLVLALGAF